MELPENYPLETIRHSTAHLLAHAVERLWPECSIQWGVGPVIEHGFYYDVAMERKLSDADLATIEETMVTITKEALPIEREVMDKGEALDFFRQRGQEFKVEIIESLPENEEIGLYRQGEFVDLCKGPHVGNTGELPRAFKLLHVAGAYWRGDERRPMLQRIYGVSFREKKELKNHLRLLDEAKKRDHRKIGKELNLFHFSDLAPASPFFMPKGSFIYNRLVDFMREIYRKFHYNEVITPQILDSNLWQTSGHYEHYRQNMYFSRIDGREYAMKPMNCPCHMLMFKHYKYSYRDLPLRYADFGRLHRYEKHGALAGLTRVRSFCQDDAHIFLGPGDIGKEIHSLMDMFLICYRHFGFKDIRINLSTRPAKRAGSDSVWDQSEKALEESLKTSGHLYSLRKGEGAFYGPKIDVEISDALGRYHQLGTIQLDFHLPERFCLHYTDSDGKEKRPIVIHRALFGSLERFLGVYIEHVAGVFPFWLAPEQIVLIPVSGEAHSNYVKSVEKSLLARGIRASVDNRNETLGYKTRWAQKNKIPFMAVLGNREMESGEITLRRYGEKTTETLSLEKALILFEELNGEAIPLEFR